MTFIKKHPVTKEVISQSQRLYHNVGLYT